MKSWFRWQIISDLNSYAWLDCTQSSVSRNKQTKKSDYFWKLWTATLPRLMTCVQHVDPPGSWQTHWHDLLAVYQYHHGFSNHTAVAFTIPLKCVTALVIHYSIKPNVSSQSQSQCHLFHREIYAISLHTQNLGVTLSSNLSMEKCVTVFADLLSYIEFFFKIVSDMSLSHKKPPCLCLCNLFCKNLSTLIPWYQVYKTQQPQQLIISERSKFVQPDLSSAQSSQTRKH